MLCKACVFIITLLIFQKICQTCSKALPVTRDNNDGLHKSSTTSYYRHNIFGANTYAFGFEVNDKDSGNIQFRDERRYANGTVEGSYGYVRPDGTVMVTNYLADSENGYLSKTQNFATGDEPKWQQNWPTKKPNILIEKPMASSQPTVTYDDKQKLNLTSILLPVEPVKEKHGIDLNPPKLEKELVNPVVLEVINGEAPLIAEPKRKDGIVGFETINKYIPSNFPIVPFELPQEDLKINLTTGLSDKPIPVLKSVDEPPSKAIKYDTQKQNNDEKIVISAEKYIKSKENNAEKSLPNAVIKTSEQPQAKAISIDKNKNWYDKIIKQMRQEYLEDVQ